MNNIQGEIAAQLEAKRRHDAGERVNFSTSIEGTLTYGYGALDDYGFWEFPLRFEYLSADQQAVVRRLDAKDAYGDCGGELQGDSDILWRAYGAVFTR